MSKRTPTPWNISPVRTTEDTAMIVSGEGFEPIADVTEDGNAAFIVKAVNNHDALVKTLDECRNALAMMIEPETIQKTSTLHAWSHAVAAERKASATLAAVSAPGENSYD